MPPAGDYETTAGDLVFEDGESQKEISVKIFDDDEVEAMFGGMSAVIRDGMLSSEEEEESSSCE